MYPIKEFGNRFRELLDELDSVKDEASEEVIEELEELNADYEDALFVIDCIGEKDEDGDEQMSDALDEFSDLCDSYRELAEELPALKDAVQRLSALVQMARANLPE